MQKIFDFILNCIINIKSFVSVMIVSVFFITVGSLLCWFYNNPAYNKTKNWITSVGTICEITNKVAYCDHVVEDITYEHCKLDGYIDEFQVGGRLKIKYNPNDPYEITCLNDDKSTLVGMYVACYVVAAIIPVGYLGIGFYRYHQRTSGGQQIKQKDEDK